MKRIVFRLVVLMLLVTGVAGAQMAGRAVLPGTFVPSPPAAGGAMMSGAISPSILTASATMMMPSTLVIGDDGTAYVLLEADYSDLKAIKTTVSAVFLPGVSGTGWKAGVEGLGKAIVAGTNAVVVAASPAFVWIGTPVYLPLPPPSTPTLSPIARTAPPATTLHFLKPATGAVLRDPIAIDGTFLSLAVKKVGNSEYVYALVRVMLPLLDPTALVVPQPRLKLMVISLTDSWTRTVDVASGEPEQQ